MSAPPLSKFLPEGTELVSSGDLAVRVERDGDGVRVTLRDRWGWHWIGHCSAHEVDGRKGYGGVVVQQEVPEALRLPGDDEPAAASNRPKPRGIAPKVRA